jgi:tryptophanyl-tRNA synthetase
MTTMGQLEKMTQFKDKSSGAKLANGTTFVPTGIFMYPVLMAADILLYGPKYVPVGLDQKQHVELARNIAQSFNSKFGPTFDLPEPLISKEGAKIMDLVNPTAKMSKSAADPKGAIFLLDDVEVSLKKIMSSKTDGLNKVNFDQKNQPGISNLISIMSYVSNDSIESIVKKYQAKNYGEFKKDLCVMLKKYLLEFQKKFNVTIKNKTKLISSLNANAEICRKESQKILDKVYKKIGLIK